MWDEIISYYQTQDMSDQSVLIECLKEIQEINGYLSNQDIEKICDIFKLQKTYIQGLIKVYPSLKAASFDHTITLCTGARCGAKNGAGFIQFVEKTLGVDKNSISKDGKFYIKKQNCLKHCHTSINMKIDDTLYENMSQDKFKKIIKDIH